MTGSRILIWKRFIRILNSGRIKALLCRQKCRHERAFLAALFLFLFQIFIQSGIGNVSDKHMAWRVSDNNGRLCIFNSCLRCDTAGPEHRNLSRVDIYRFSVVRVHDIGHAELLPDLPFEQGRHEHLAFFQ